MSAGGNDEHRILNVEGRWNERRRGIRGVPTLAWFRHSLANQKVVFTVLPQTSGWTSARAMERPSLNVLFSFGRKYREGRGGCQQEMRGMCVCADWMWRIWEWGIIRTFGGFGTPFDFVRIQHSLRSGCDMLFCEAETKKDETHPERKESRQRSGRP
jgi:hypothetical protein